MFPRSRRRGGKRAARLDHENVALLPTWQFTGKALQVLQFDGLARGVVGGQRYHTVWMMSRICANDRDFFTT